MNNTADINYFKDPLNGKTGEIAFKEKLPSILESHEENINDLKDAIETLVTITTTAFNIPTGLPEGTKYLFRKRGTTGKISINTQGTETIGNETMKSVHLNTAGDFWLMEKVTPTRWDLVYGKYSGMIDIYNYFVCRADSTFVSGGYSSTGYVANVIKEVPTYGIGFFTSVFSTSTIFGIVPLAGNDYNWYINEGTNDLVSRFMSLNTLINGLVATKIGKWYNA